MLHSCTDFYLVVCVDDLVIWESDDAERPVANPRFQAVLSALGVDMGPVALHARYYDGPPVGARDVYVHRQPGSDAVFAIELHDSTEDGQLDLVRIGGRTGKAELVWPALRDFFDSAEYRMQYLEAWKSLQVSTLIGEIPVPAPAPVAKRGFLRRLFRRPN
jgi:hypothetical protein